MMQRNSSIFIALTLVLTTLSWESSSLSAKPARASLAEAVITRSKHMLVEVTGRVELKRQGASSFRSVSRYTQIRSGDLLRTASGARVRILCDNGNTRSVPAGTTTGLNQICPPSSSSHSTRPIVSPRPGDAYIPYIISPRATSVLTEKPRLRWNDATDAISFQVTVRGRGLNWTEEFSREQVCQNGICEVVYPGNPPLQPGVSYKLVVDANTKANQTRSSEEDRTGRLGFKRIESNEAKTVQEIAQRIERENLPNEVKALALAELYADYNLNAEAIESLEKLEQNVKIASVYRWLGNLYWRIGLVLEAETHFLKAVELAKVSKNLEEVAAATAGLGEVKYARNYREEGRSLLEQAKAIYEQLEDGQRVREVEEKLAQLR